MNKDKVIFLIDFDITISKKDSTDTLLNEYNPKLKEEIRRKYRSKEITMREILLPWTGSISCGNCKTERDVHHWILS